MTVITPRNRALKSVAAHNNFDFNVYHCRNQTAQSVAFALAAADAQTSRAEVKSLESRPMCIRSANETASAQHTRADRIGKRSSHALFIFKAIPSSSLFSVRFFFFFSSLAAESMCTVKMIFWCVAHAVHLSRTFSYSVLFRQLPQLYGR